MRENKTISVVLSLCIAIAVLTVSIAVPLLCRPFYYAHIRPLDLAEVSGMTEGQIREAFDEVMDFCLGKSQQFSAGKLVWSEEGASHFADVRTLFVLDLCLAVISCAAVILLLLYCRIKKRRPYFFRDHRPGFWSAAGLGAVFVTAGGLAALDFDRAFVVFHGIFFPGKDNWILDYQTDPVIWILPQEFFRNCGILILCLVVLWCALLIGGDLWYNRKDKDRRQFK